MLRRSTNPMSARSATSLPFAARRSLLFYNLLFPLAFIALLPGFLLRMVRRGQFREHFGQRLGLFSAAARSRLSAHRWTWVHSISVGETFVALKLIREMKRLDPSLRVLLSVTTTTGFAQARSAGADWLEVIYNPVDLRSIVRRTMRIVRPRRFIFIEAIWPNLLAAAKAAEVPVALIPRLSPRSERRFRRFRWLTAPIFALLDRVCGQEEEDHARWSSLGVPSDRIAFTGSIKFDPPAEPPASIEKLRALLDRLGVPRDAPILLGGSTFPGEERILGEAFLALRSDFPSLFLIAVPRHVERAGEAIADLQSLGFRVARRTGVDDAGGNTDPKADCLVVDTTGELRHWYRLATVVFIGKTITAAGGQNPVEAVMAGAPVIVGPHTENFRVIIQRWLAEDAVIQIPAPSHFVSALRSLLCRQDLRESLVHRARSLLLPHQNATARAAQEILQL
jgi:3-deoxy-D-manno-octulosonic-acid transferase